MDSGFPTFDGVFMFQLIISYTFIILKNKIKLWRFIDFMLGKGVIFGLGKPCAWEKGFQIAPSGFVLLTH